MTARPADPNTSLPHLVVRSRKMLALQREKMQRDIETYASAPAPDSPFRRDETSWKAAPHRQRAHQRRLWTGTRQLGRLLVANVVFHLNAAARLLDDPSTLLWAPSTVTRVACEAAAKIAYLLDPSLSYELRITRTAGMLLDSAHQQIKAATNVTGVVPNAVERATGERDKLLKQVIAAGIIAPTDVGYVISPAGDKVPRTPKPTTLVADHFPNRPSLYQQTSAVVHSTPWTLTSAISSEPNERYLTLEPDILELGATALAGLDATHLVTTTHARYWGHDPHRATTDWQRKTRVIDDLLKAWWFDHAADQSP